jgi:1-acyl-sn-glycerol-3-phosphate acyltransferase
MITAKHSRLGTWFWAQWSRWGIRLLFEDFRYEERVEVDPRRALLLVGNHISWWDGFWPLWLNHKHLGKRFHAMMLEEQLAQRRFLRSAGGFSINPRSRSVIASLSYAAELLSDPKNLLLIYPQGKIHSLYDQPIRFEKGLEKVLQLTQAPVQLVFSVALLDYHARPRPSLYYRLREYEGDVQAPLAEIERAYQSFYDHCLERQREIQV